MYLFIVLKDLEIRDRIFLGRYREYEIRFYLIIVK